jgi:predicted RNA polymerase sigma factor
LAQSAAGTEISVYHLQAGIAACHCAARDAKATDWRQILVLYDRLVELDDSPIVALNRAVAVANVHGPAAGMSALKPLRDRKELSSYYLLYAILGEFEAQLGNPEIAAGYFRQALKQTVIASEQHLLRKRLRECEKQLTPQLVTG